MSLPVSAIRICALETDYEETDSTFFGGVPGVAPATIYDYLRISGARNYVRECRASSRKLVMAAFGCHLFIVGYIGVVINMRGFMASVDAFAPPRSMGHDSRMLPSRMGAVGFLSARGPGLSGIDIEIYCLPISNNVISGLQKKRTCDAGLGSNPVLCWYIWRFFRFGKARLQIVYPCCCW